MQNRHALAAVLACAGAAIGQAAVGEEADPWAFEVTPYFLAAGLDGTIGLRGIEGDVDASFSDIWDNLDAGFMGLFTARRGPWLFGAEAVYFKLSSDVDLSNPGPGGNVSAQGKLGMTTKMYIYQGTVGYRVFDDVTTVDLTGALRYTKLDVGLSINVETDPGIVFPGGGRSASGTESWTDFVVGAIVRHPLNDEWSLAGLVDLGGGGSDLTWQFIAGVDWAFRENLSAKLGYRYLYWDYEDDGTKWDMAASGPYLGLGIRF